MSKYKSLFINDTGDHLDALESDLVELERRPDNREHIHEVFRHLHSIKGMAGAMGYESMSHLAHRLEDLMYFHREQGMALRAEEVNLLLRALDEFRKQLEAVANELSPEQAPTDLLASIEQQLREMKPVELKTVIRSSRETPAHLPEQPKDSGSYLIQATISAGCSTPSIRAFLIYKRLVDIGRVVEAVPSVEEMRSGGFQGRDLRYRLVTDRRLVEIKELVGTLAELDGVEIRPEGGEVSKPPGQVAQIARSEAPATHSKPPTVRVRAELLDFFVDSVGELITLRSFFEDLSERLENPALLDGVQRLNKVVRKLHDRVMEVRMVSVSLLTSRLPRVCRDIAHQRGRKVNFNVEGEEVELDRALVESLDTPMLHLLRNAVDHGIETPEERLAAGKPPEGRIQLMVRREADRVRLTLSDDGRGIDCEKILARAKQKGLSSRKSGGDHPVDVIDLIFEPGFSTCTEVTEVSGRGVGLDAVRKVMGSLGGRISVNSEPGRGTSFILDLPLTIAILQVLLVETGGYLLALPASRVLRALPIDRSRVTEVDGKDTVTLGGKTFPVVDLLKLIEGDQASTAGVSGTGESVLVGEGNHPLIALAVERISGHREVVLKTVGHLLRSLGPFCGSTVLGDGQPVLILDVDALAKRAGKSQPGA